MNCYSHIKVIVYENLEWTLWHFRGFSLVFAVVFSRDRLSLIFNELRRRPSTSKIKSRIPAKNGRPGVSSGPIKLGRFSRRECRFGSRRNDQAFLFPGGRRVYYRCIEARRKRARKRGCWHNSGIFLEIWHRYSCVCALSICIFSERTNRSDALRLLRNGSLGITRYNELMICFDSMSFGCRFVSTLPLI